MSINYKVISDAVFKSIKAYILTMLDFETSVVNVKNTYQIRQKKQSFENDIRDVSYKIKEIKKHRFDLFRDYIEEVIEADEFNFARENYSTEIEFLSEKLKLLKKEYSQFNKTLEPQEWIERFKTYRSARHLSKEMVDYFIDRITVNKDNTIEIKWRFSKEQLMEMGDIA